MTEVVDGLSEGVSAMFLVSGNFGHDEICLTESRPSRIHSYEDLSYRLDVEVFS